MGARICARAQAAAIAPGGGRCHRSWWRSPEMRPRGIAPQVARARTRAYALARLARPAGVARLSAFRLHSSGPWWRSWCSAAGGGMWQP